MRALAVLGVSWATGDDGLLFSGLPAHIIDRIGRGVAGPLLGAGSEGCEEEV